MSFIPVPRRVRTALGFLAAAVVVIMVVLSLPKSTLTEPSATDGLPHSSQAYQAALRQATLPKAQSQPAIVVYSRSDGQTLEPSQAAALGAQAPRLAQTVAAVDPTSASSVLGPIQVSNSKKVAFSVISVSTEPNANVVSDRIGALRSELAKLTPTGIATQVTGGPAFSTDIGHVFDGADLTLLLATVIVVAILLIITYRSPLLWLVPLLVVGMADQVSGQLAAVLAPHLGIRLDGAATGISEVLVFGAGTDYALLLIARYREQLRTTEDRFAAMRTAVSRTAEAILASGTTVTISLLLLLLASMASTRALGFAAAIGIVVAMTFGLLVLPAGLLVCGRGVFWPLVPRAGEIRHADGRIFGRIGASVERRPVVVIVASVAFLVVAALFGTGIHVGLSTTQQFTATPESVVGQDVLASAFPAGSSDPVIILTATPTTEATRAAVAGVAGITKVTVGASGTQWTELDATMTAAPGSSAAFTTIDAVRSAVAGVPGAEAVVGGDTATDLDAARASNHDTWLIAPLILLVVVCVLLLLLRAVVAPLLLLATVLLSFFAALGISWLIFIHIAHYPAMAAGVPFLGFLFLVALGVDYNIFLTSRAREEAAAVGSRAGMLAALTSTGGVITSAGILLASVFAVLGVLPLIQLTQIGIIVCVGVLLDTLLVRTVLVPALAFLLGDRFWWPSTSATESSAESLAARTGETGPSGADDADPVLA
jgi:RND superfamily putative drug exporter